MGSISFTTRNYPYCDIFGDEHLYDGIHVERHLFGNVVSSGCVDSVNGNDGITGHWPNAPPGKAAGRNNRKLKGSASA
jgi:hypothetical protein